MKARGISADLARYFSKRPGMQVFLDDLMEEFKDKYTPQQVQSNVNNLKRLMGSPMNIITNINGRAWTYQPNGQDGTPALVAAKKTMTFIEIGQTRDGTMLIQSEDDKIYKAVEL